VKLRVTRRKRLTLPLKTWVVFQQCCVLLRILWWVRSLLVNTARPFWCTERGSFLAQSLSRHQEAL
jgi:hypothetical protein